MICASYLVVSDSARQSQDRRPVLDLWRDLARLDD